MCYTSYEKTDKNSAVIFIGGKMIKFYSKMILKLILIAIVATIIFIIFSAMAPYSAEFVAANASADAGSTAMIGFLVYHLWLAFTVYYITRNSLWTGKKRFWAIVFSLVMVANVMTQIETLFFGSAFSILTRIDVLVITLVNTVPVLAIAFLVLVFFKKENKAADKQKTEKNTEVLYSKQSLSIVFLSLSFAYMIIYFIFGYFVAWQSESLRVFYSGETYKLGFFQKMVENFVENPIIFPFQVIRGFLFSLSVLPLVYMLKAKSKQLLVSLIFVYCSIGIVMLIPNFLFPDAVRWAHFWELVGSMLVFAVLSWYLFSRGQKWKKTAS